MNEYNKELEWIIKHTIAYMVTERKGEVKDADMSIEWKIISDKMQNMGVWKRKYCLKIDRYKCKGEDYGS